MKKSPQNFVTGIATMLVLIAGANSQAQSFVDVSASAGIVGDSLNKSWGSPVWGDINNDGYLDVLVSVHGVLGTNKPFTYLNNGNGTFTNNYTTSGLFKGSWRDPVSPDDGDWHGWALGDFDRDGRLDVAIVEGSKDNDFTKRDKLFKGAGDGTFTNVAATAGFDLNVHTGGSGFWVDFNNDGKLDLFVKNWTTSANELFQSNGDGTFTEVAASAGLADVRGSNSAWADYDNDGYMDVMTTGLGGLIPEPPDALFHNNGNGTFTEVTANAGLPVRTTGRGIAWGDYDNDGNIDVYIARGEAGSVPPDGSTKTSLYRNNGDGTFTEVTDQAGVGITANSWAAIWGDYDNDGNLDLFVTNSGDNPNNNACYLFHNNGNGTFTNVAAAEGLELQDNLSAHKGASWADYDNDGFLDLMIKNGVGTEDAGESSKGTHRLYHNTHAFNPNHWLKIKLLGVQSNLNGIGAKLKLTTTTGSQFRQNDGGGGGALYSQSSQPVHFGLGQATQGDLQITWPSGVVDTLTSVEANQTLTVTEGQSVATPQLFVTTSNSNAVAVINSGSNQVIAQIPVGRSPIRIAMTPDGRKAYVSNGADSTVSVIDTAHRVVTGTISVGAGPQESAVTPDGGRLFVVHKSSGDIAVVDTSTDTVITHVAVGGFGSKDVLVSPDGRFTYVANATASMVNVIDNSTYLVVSNIPTPAGPRRLAFTPGADRLFVSDYDGASVSVIDTATKALIGNIAVGNNPRTVAITPGGNEIYVTNVGDGTVSVINNLSLSVVATIPVGHSPWQVAITPDGAWAYVSNGSSRSVSVINTTSHAVTKTLRVGVGPFFSVINPGATELYVCNSRDTTVSVIDLVSQTVFRTIQGVGAQPFDLSFDAPQASVSATLHITPLQAARK